MDAQMVIGLVGVGAVFTPFGIAIGRQMTIRADIARLAKKLHDYEETYVPKETLRLTLAPMTEAINRIEHSQADMAKDVKSVTRWMDQHGGMGV